MQEYIVILKSVFSLHFGKMRLRLGITQDAMSELLHIVPRSYIELEHGNSLCSSPVLIFFLLLCDEEEIINLLYEIRSDFAKVAEQDDVA